MTAFHAALAAAQAAVSPLSKDGKNEHHKYRYTTSEAVIDEGRSALSANGLSLICQRAFVSHEDVVETLTTQDGEVKDRTARHYMLTACYRLFGHGEQVEISSETPIIPEKGRPLDKALAAAKTYDLAYTLRSLLLIPRSDALAREAEVDQRDDRQPSARVVATEKAIQLISDQSVDVAGLFDAATDQASYDFAVAAATKAFFGVGPDDPKRIAARAALKRAQDRIPGAKS